MATTLEGGCLCGAVRYALTPPLRGGAYCHCRMCQQASGAPVVAWTTLAAEWFRYSAGEPATYQSSAKAVREFCPKCGTQLTFRLVADEAWVDVTLASLDEPGSAQPRYHIWTSSQLPWLELADDLPRHAEER